MLGSRRVPVDHDRLALYLRALGVPNRLALLRQLQVPRAAAEVRLPPARRDRERDPERPISRAAVELHLKKLEELGIVLGRGAERDGRALTEYVLNPARLFVVVEELRRVMLLRAQTPTGTASAEDGEAVEPAPPVLPQGDALVAANGPFEGIAFPLDGRGPWTIGRERGCHVTLAYDPFVSKENTVLERAGGVLRARDVPGSKNGTRVNWRPVGANGAALAAGDILGVGRSLLVVRAGRSP